MATRSVARAHQGARGSSSRSTGRSTGPSAAAFAGVGIQLGLTLTLFALLGRWADARLGTGPWLLLLCVAVGATAGLYSIYRRVIGPGTTRGPGGRAPSSGPDTGGPS